MLTKAVKKAIKGLQIITPDVVDIYNTRQNGDGPDRAIRILEQIRDTYTDRYDAVGYHNAISYDGWQTVLTLPCEAD